MVYGYYMSYQQIGWFGMQATNTIKKWVVSTLNDNGFDGSKLKVMLNELLPVAMAGEGRKNPDYWTGLYHVIAFDGSVCLYAYNQREKNGNFFKSDIAASDMDPIDQPPEFQNDDPDLIVKISRKEALNDPKFQKELDSVQNFIQKHQGNIDIRDQKVVHEPQPKVIDFESEHGVVDFMPQDERQEHGKAAESHGAPEKLEQLHVDEFAPIVANNLVELFDLLDSEINPNHWAFNVYRGIDLIGYDCIKVINRPVQLTNQVIDLNGDLIGNVLIRYGDSQNSNMPVMGLGFLTSINGQSSELPCFIAEENNFIILGGELTPDDKWCFVANDFKSALSIYRATGIKTIAAPRGMDIGFVFNEVLRTVPQVKIRFFRNEHINMRSARVASMKYDADYNIGHIFIDLDYPTWGDYSDLYFEQYGEDADSKFKGLIQDALREGNQFIEAL